MYISVKLLMWTKMYTWKATETKLRNEVDKEDNSSIYQDIIIIIIIIYSAFYCIYWFYYRVLPYLHLFNLHYIIFSFNSYLHFASIKWKLKLFF